MANRLDTKDKGVKGIARRDKRAFVEKLASEAKKAAAKEDLHSK